MFIFNLKVDIENIIWLDMSENSFNLYSHHTMQCMFCVRYCKSPEDIQSYEDVYNLFLITIIIIMGPQNVLDSNTYNCTNGNNRCIFLLSYVSNS